MVISTWTSSEPAFFYVFYTTVPEKNFPFWYTPYILSVAYILKIRFFFNENMLFVGNDEALAFMQLKSIGLPESATAQLSATLCEHMESYLHVPKDRTYIEFADAPRKMWGYNGSTF